MPGKLAGCVIKLRKINIARSGAGDTVVFFQVTGEREKKYCFVERNQTIMILNRGMWQHMLRVNTRGHAWADKTNRDREREKEIEMER